MDPCLLHPQFLRHGTLRLGLGPMTPGVRTSCVSDRRRSLQISAVRDMFQPASAQPRMLPSLAAASSCHQRLDWRAKLIQVVEQESSMLSTDLFLSLAHIALSVFRGPPAVQASSQTLRHPTHPRAPRSASLAGLRLQTVRGSGVGDQRLKARKIRSTRSCLRTWSMLSPAGSLWRRGSQATGHKASWRTAQDNGAVGARCVRACPLSARPSALLTESALACMILPLVGRMWQGLPYSFTTSIVGVHALEHLNHWFAAFSESCRSQV